MIYENRKDIIFMDIAIIKDGVCIDVIVGEAAVVQKMFIDGMWDADIITVLPDGYGVGDLFDGETWSHPWDEPPEQPEALTLDEIDTIKGLVAAVKGENQ